MKVTSNCKICNHSWEETFPDDAVVIDWTFQHPKAYYNPYEAIKAGHRHHVFPQKICISCKSDNSHITRID